MHNSKFLLILNFIRSITRNKFNFLVDILLKATGNAPIMKKKKWAVDAEKHIGWIIEFVKKYLKLEPEEKLVCFTFYLIIIIILEKSVKMEYLVVFSNLHKRMHVVFTRANN